MRVDFPIQLITHKYIGILIATLWTYIYLIYLTGQFLETLHCAECYQSFLAQTMSSKEKLKFFHAVEESNLQLEF